MNIEMLRELRGKRVPSRKKKEIRGRKRIDDKPKSS